MDIIQGRVWVFGNNVDTDQILPGYAMSETMNLAKYAMAGSQEPRFSSKVKTGDIVVAGKNFGCGSSREQAPVALKEAGVALVVAASFARIFRRNAINIGLPVFTADISHLVQIGDLISVNIISGIVLVDNGKAKIQGTPLSNNIRATLEAGGLIARVKKELGLTERRE